MVRLTAARFLVPAGLLGVVRAQTADGDACPERDDRLATLAPRRAHLRALHQNQVRSRVRVTQLNVRHQPDLRAFLLGDTRHGKPQLNVSTCSAQYAAGAVTLMAINMRNVTGPELVTFTPPLSSQVLDEYLLTPAGVGGVQAR